MTSGDGHGAMPEATGRTVARASVLLPLAVALPVSLGVALLTSRLTEFRWLGPWGLLYGSLAFPAAFGLSLLFLRRRVRVGWLSLGAAASLAVAALCVARSLRNPDR